MNYSKFLVSDEIITLKATMPDGSEHDTHWKKCQHTYYERWRAAEASGDLGKIERAKQQFIAASLVNPDGTPALTERDSIKLTTEGVMCLFPKAMEANGIVSRADPKAPSREDQSDTSSDT